MTWVPARGVGAFTWRGCLRVEACGARACNFQRTYMTTVATAVDVSFPSWTLLASWLCLFFVFHLGFLGMSSLVVKLSTSYEYWPMY